MKTHLILKLKYSLEEIEKKVGRPLTEDEIADLERNLLEAIENEMGDSLRNFVFELIGAWVE